MILYPVACVSISFSERVLASEDWFTVFIFAFLFVFVYCIHFCFFVCFVYCIHLFLIIWILRGWLVQRPALVGLVGILPDTFALFFAVVGSGC